MIVIDYNGFFRFLKLTFNIKVYLFLSLPFQFFFSLHPLTLYPFSLYTHPIDPLPASLPQAPFAPLMAGHGETFLLVDFSGLMIDTPQLTPLSLHTPTPRPRAICIKKV